MTGNQLPGLAHVDGLNQFRLSQFFGFDHRLGAQNGYIWDMHNLTGDYAPVLAFPAPAVDGAAGCQAQRAVLLRKAVPGGRDGPDRGRAGGGAGG